MNLLLNEFTTPQTYYDDFTAINLPGIFFGS